MAAKYILSIIFIVVYTAFGSELGFAANSPLYTHFTYSFQHASILHLTINTLVFINVFRVMEKFLSWRILLTAIYVIATFASFVSVHDIPTVGASGMIYAIFGMMVVIVSNNKSTFKQKATFFCSIGIMLLFSFFNKNSNFVVHIASFILGFIYFLIYHNYDKRRHTNKSV